MVATVLPPPTVPYREEVGHGEADENDGGQHGRAEREAALAKVWKGGDTVRIR